jgi:hypothetical protein
VRLIFDVRQNMKLILKPTILLLITVGLSGCVIPYKYSTQQGAAGFVSDESNGTPIQGAVVVVSQGRQNFSTTETETQSDGTFSLPGTTKWGIYMVPMDPIPIPWSLKVSAEGYLDYSVDESTSILQKSIRNLGEIKMKKEPNQ